MPSFMAVRLCIGRATKSANCPALVFTQARPASELTGGRAKQIGPASRFPHAPERTRASLAIQLAQVLTKKPVVAPPLGAGVSTIVPVRFAPIDPMVKSARGVPVVEPTLNSRTRVLAVG